MKIGRTARTQMYADGQLTRLPMGELFLITQDPVDDSRQILTHHVRNLRYP